MYTRRTFLAVGLVLQAVLCVSSSGAALVEIPRPATLDLTVLHDNDIHGHVFPFQYIETGRGQKDETSRGGAARRATLIQRLRREIRNPVMLVDSGDLVTRGPLWTSYEGEPDVEALNALGYDIAAIGNNEFKIKSGADENDAAGSQAALLLLIKRSRCPWVCANATNGHGDSLEGVQPYVVRTIGGVRVGFLGLTAPRSATYPQTKGWTIIDPVTAANEWIPRARTHCDILIALTHIGDDLDRDLAAKTTGLDAIVGGDSHTYLYKALEVANPDGTKVPIVQDGEFGVDLGRFDLHFVHPAGGAWKLASYQYQLLPVDSRIPEDPAIARLLEPYHKQLDMIIGRVPQVGRDPKERTRLTTQVEVDAIRRVLGLDLALAQEGDGLFETFRRQEVTLYDLYAALPFHDTVSTVVMTGGEIKALLAAQPVPASTVTSGPTTALDDQKEFRVGLVGFAATGTYKLASSRIQDTGRDIRDVIIQYLKG